MATIKSYTDLDQSRKLAEILPLESADMAWCNNFIKGIDYTDKYSANLYTVKEMKETFDKELVGWDKYWKLIPCWSLAALLSVLPHIQEFYPTIGKANGRYVCHYVGSGTWTNGNNPIDACYEMILELHERKML